MTLIGVFSSCDATETNSAFSLSSSASCVLIVRKLAASRPNSSWRCAWKFEPVLQVPLGHRAHALLERTHRAADRAHQPDRRSCAASRMRDRPARRARPDSASVDERSRLARRGLASRSQICDSDRLHCSFRLGRSPGSSIAREIGVARMRSVRARYATISRSMIGPASRRALARIRFGAALSGASTDNESAQRARDPDRSRSAVDARVSAPATPSATSRARTSASGVAQAAEDERRLELPVRAAPSTSPAASSSRRAR